MRKSRRDRVALIKASDPFYNQSGICINGKCGAQKAYGDYCQPCWAKILRLLRDDARSRPKPIVIDEVKWKEAVEFDPIRTKFESLTIRKGPDECWPYTGRLNDKGYGRIQIDKRTYIATHVAWMLEYGEYPKQKCILHRCDNPPCVNPAHLMEGTNLDNSIDMAQKGRSHKAMPAQIVREVFRLLESGERPADVSRTLGISGCFVGRARRKGKRWFKYAFE